MLNTFSVDDAPPPADILVLTDPFTSSDSFEFDGAAAESSTDPMAPAPFAEPSLHQDHGLSASDPANIDNVTAEDSADKVDSPEQEPAEPTASEPVETSKPQDDIRSEPALVPPSPLSISTVTITVEEAPTTHAPPVIMETPPTFAATMTITLCSLPRLAPLQGRPSGASLRSCQPASCAYMLVAVMLDIIC